MIPVLNRLFLRIPTPSVQNNIGKTVLQQTWKRHLVATGQTLMLESRNLPFAGHSLPNPAIDKVTFLKELDKTTHQIQSKTKLENSC